MNFLIVSGGNTNSEFANELIKNSKFDVIIAADSGLNYFYEQGLVPDIAVGDFDSVDSRVLEYFTNQVKVEIIKLNPVKDDTDTEHAIRYAISQNAHKITIIGGTGSRLDHVMGNICLLGIGFEENIEIELLDPNNRIRLINKPTTIRKADQFGRFVSLIPFAGEVKGVTLKGMKYCLDNYNMGGFNSLGISNEIEDDEASISFDEGVLLLIESRDN